MRVFKTIILSSAFFVMALLAVGENAQAGIFQFSSGDAKYMAALSAALTEETEEEVNVEEKINLDEDFKPEDFGLEGVGILPTNPFYFLKGARRGVTSLFTFDPAKKAELKLQFASEKIMEARELSQKEGANEKDVRDALDNFKAELNRVEIATTKAAGVADESAKEKLSEKIMDSVMKYEKSLGKFEKEISPEFFKDIKDAKDSTSETFGIVFQLAEPEKVSEKLTEVLDKQSGSEFKHFKNLEVLKEVEEKVPEQAKEAIRLAQENALNRLQSELEKFESAKRAIFTDFVKQVGGNEIRHLEILNELEVRPLSDDLRKALVGAKEETLERTENRLTKLADPEQKEIFLEHLLDGQFKDVRLMTELEDNMTEGVLRDLAGVKSRVEEGFQSRVVNIGTDEIRQKEFIDSVERFHDVKSISLIAKMEELIPEDKRAFFTELKSRAAEEMERDIKNTRDKSQKNLIYNALASDRPKDLETVEDFSGIFKGIKESMVGRIQNKAGSIKNKERLLFYKEEFKKNKSAVSSPKFSEIGDIFQERITYFDEPEKIRMRISEVSRLVAELRSLVDALPIDKGYADGKFEPVIQDINRLLAMSEKKLGVARAYYESGEIDRAFGEVEVVEFLARDGIKLAKDYMSGSRRVEKPKGYLEIRDGAYWVYNKYEFGQFCSMMRGFSKSPLVCSLTDGTILDLNQTSFPFSYPIANLNCGGFGGGSCPAGYSCKIPPDTADAMGKCAPEENFTCTAFFTGYVYDQRTGFCRQESASGCSDPYVYHSKEECGKANQTERKCSSPYVFDSVKQGCVIPLKYPFTFPVSNYVCNDYQGCYDYCSTTTRGGYEIDSVCWEYWPAKCGNNVCEKGETPLTCKTDCGSSSYCGDGLCSADENTEICPKDCKTGTIIFPGDERSCPGFAHSEWDQKGVRYCQLNELRTCEYNYPSYLDRTNYTSQECPFVGCGDNKCDSFKETSESCPADCQVTPTICPSLPTVNSCPAGEQMVVTWSSPECGEFYGCVPAIIVDFYCGDGVCNAGESMSSCPSDCGVATQNWVKHGWTFSDGLTESSMIFNRTDSDYLNFIAQKDNECRKIPRSKFTWKTGAENDDAANWQNFGIPDCSVTVSLCGNGTCNSGETYENCSSDCAPAGSCGDGVCSSSETAATCSTDCASTVSNCPSGFHYHSDSGGYCINDQENVSGTCYNSAGTTVITCPLSGYCGNNVCDSNETSASCSVDCGSTTACNYNNICETGESSGSCPKDCSTTGGGCGSFTASADCEAKTDCKWNVSAGSCQAVFACSSPGNCGNQKDCQYSGFYWCSNNSQCYSGSAGCNASYCGDNVCQSTETQTSCSSDCGTVSLCGNGTCNSGETYENCSSDCAPAGSCGDGVCSSSETVLTCSTDCASTVSNCPSGFHYHSDSGGYCINDQENISGTCYNSAGTTVITCPLSGYCGNNVCDSNETSASCSVDCGTPTTGYCGDNVCGSSETSASCPADCGSTTACNYNNVCDTGESSGSCPNDCPTTGGGCGSITASTNCEARTDCKWNVSAGSCQALFACSSPGNCGNQKDCQYSGFYWCSNNNQCYSSLAGCSTSGTSSYNNIQFRLAAILVAISSLFKR